MDDASDGPLFEIEIDLPVAGSRAASRTLHRQLRDAIRDGRLPVGARLPPTRRASTFFGVSRNTAIEVYERLLGEGYVVARRGDGTYVADRGATTPATGAPRDEPSDPRLNPFWVRADVTAAIGYWDDPTVETRPDASIDLRPALVDARLFPLDVFRRLGTKQLRGLERRPARYRGARGPGHFPLRDAIARHVALTRAVVCTPDDIVVTSGAQQAFDLLARILVVPDVTRVAIENPGYPPMRIAFEAAGGTVVPVDVDDEGLIVERLPRDVGVICLCPSHQFPLGVTMSARRRRALLAFAREQGAVIVEDDYDGEFRHDGPALAALRSADDADVVFYVGTFSKCMLPALRLGFLIAPAWAIDTAVVAKNCLDWHCPTPVQMGVADFIDGGHLARHVRRMRRIYRRRRDAVVERLSTDLAPWLTPIASSYGMHVTAVARPSLDVESVATALRRQGVMLHTLARYHLRPSSWHGLVFGFGTADLADLDRGLTMLRATLQR